MQGVHTVHRVHSSWTQTVILNLASGTGSQHWPNARDNWKAVQLFYWLPPRESSISMVWNIFRMRHVQATRKTHMSLWEQQTICWILHYYCATAIIYCWTGMPTQDNPVINDCCSTTSLSNYVSMQLWLILFCFHVKIISHWCRIAFPQLATSRTMASHSTYCSFALHSKIWQYLSPWLKPY